MKANPVTLQASQSGAKHAVIILASGLSLRLGQSKQLLKKDSQPLISCMIELALTTYPQIVIVVIPNDKTDISAAIDQQVNQNPKLQVVLNATPESGMAHSLSLAIDTLNHLENVDSAAISRILIMGIDQVLLDSAHLDNLLLDNLILDEQLLTVPTVVASRYPQLNDDYSIDSAKDNIVGLPLTIDYAQLKQWQPQLKGDKGLRHLIRALPTHQISTIINHQLSYDIDTPEQFAHAKQQKWLDSCYNER